MKDMIKTMMTCGELTECMIVLKVNLSTDGMDGLSLSKRFKMMHFWLSVKNLESDGVEGITKKTNYANDN